MCKFLRNSLSGPLEPRRISPLAAQLNSMAWSQTAKLFQTAFASCQTQTIKAGEEQVGCMHHVLFLSLSLQLFEGNIHYDIPEVRRFDPVPAQYVRVHPERWSPAGIGMRLEVLGCDWTGRTPAPLPTGCIGAASGATPARHESKVISLPAVPPWGHAVAGRLLQ